MLPERELIVIDTPEHPIHGFAREVTVWFKLPPAALAEYVVFPASEDGFKIERYPQGQPWHALDRNGHRIDGNVIPENLRPPLNQEQPRK